MNQSDQAAAVLSNPTPGQLLAEAREARGWSVREVAMRLKFAPRQIEALEADAYNALPGAAMVRGMVRNYAKVVGLDPQPLMFELEQRLNAAPLTIVAQPTMHVPLRENSKKGTRLYVVMSLLLVLAVAGVVGWQQKNERVPTPAAPAAAVKSAPPVVEAEAAPMPVEEAQMITTPALQPVVPPVAAAAMPPIQAVAVPGRKRIEFFFDNEAWVEVKDVGGRLLMAQLHPAQSEAVLEGRPPLSLVIGNAASVRVTYDGRPIDLQSVTRQDVARITLE